MTAAVELFNRAWPHLVDILWTTVFLGALAKFFGEQAANRWLKRVEAKYAERLAKLQSQLDHSVTVSRAQFEVEFAALREIWKCVGRVRAKVGAIDPARVPAGESREQRLERFQAAHGHFNDAHNELLRAIDDHSPFYPEEVYRIVDAFRIRTALETSRLSTMSPPFASERNEDPHDWKGQRQRANDEIQAAADVVSAAIRARLASIAIRE